MRKLLIALALLLTLNTSAQIIPIDSVSFSINGNGLDTDFYALIPHNTYIASHCVTDLTTYSGWITTSYVPIITNSYISTDIAAILDTLHYTAYNAAWSNTGTPLYKLAHSRGGPIYTFKCKLY